MVLGHLVFKENLFAVKGDPNPGPRQYTIDELSTFIVRVILSEVLGVVLAPNSLSVPHMHSLLFL
jgi:hypothetical protein